MSKLQVEVLQLILLYYYNSDEDEEDAAADDFLELLRLFQSHNFGRKVWTNLCTVYLIMGAIVLFL